MYDYVKTFDPSVLIGETIVDIDKVWYVHRPESASRGKIIACGFAVHLASGKNYWLLTEDYPGLDSEGKDSEGQKQ